jgi:TonB family protein
MFSTLLESGRTRWWKPEHSAHPALSLATHAAAAFVVFSGTVPPSAMSDRMREQVTYVAPRYRVVAPDAASSGRGSAPRDEAVPRRAAKLRAPRGVPDRLPPVPAVDVAALAVPVITDVRAASREAAHSAPGASELLAGAGDAVLAQIFRGYPPVAGSLADLFERGLVPDEDNPSPVYPPRLLAQGVEGSVSVAFVVDTTGRPDPRTMQVLRSSDELFTRAVRKVLPRLRFRPAQSGALKVAILVEQPFVFALR